MTPRLRRCRLTVVKTVKGGKGTSHTLNGHVVPPSGMRLIKLLLPFAALLLVALACAPTVSEGQERTVLAVMNGPAEARLPGTAEDVQGELLSLLRGAYRFVPNSTMRFRETHMDLYRSRADGNAAQIARSEGAALAVMVGAPLLEREVREGAGGLRYVDVRVVLEARLIRPDDANVIAVVRSNHYSGSRTEPKSFELLPVEEDPTVVALRQRAAAELASSLAGELEGSGIKVQRK